MTPQLVDLNADGNQDIILTTFEGAAFWIEGSKRGWKKPDYIRDKDGKKICISLFMDIEAKDFAFVDRSTDEYKSNENHHLTSISSVDWDDDGDLDLLLGSDSGHLYLCKNEGTAKRPAFSTTNDRVFAAGKQINITDGMSNPKVVDWNKDGLFDILCGASRRGGIYLFLNIGQPGKPEFAAAKTLLSPTMKFPAPPKNLIYTDASFDVLMAVAEKDGFPSCPRQGYFVEAIDYDNDGDLDLVVGGSGYFLKLKTTLTKDEQKQISELEEKIATVQRKITQLAESSSSKGREKLLKSESFKKLHGEMHGLFYKKRRLQNRCLPSKGWDYIWIYRNLGKK